MQTSINISEDLLRQVDDAKGTKSRSGFIVECIALCLSGGDTDKKQLIADLKASNETQHKLENDIEFFRAQNQQLTDAITQRLLETPKKSLWDRIRGR